jgi:phosphoribosylformylglycinamidine cyclo-ligase
VIVARAEAEQVATALDDAGETVLEIGRIDEGGRGCTVSGGPGSWNSPKDWFATHNA